MKKKDYLKKGIFILKILALILIGFLPSFVFIALFVQYGSPLLNYLSFLSDLSASWMAWLSAVAIIFFLYSIRKLVKSKNGFRKILKNKYLLVTLIFFSLAIVFLISAQLYLYVNFVLGNDILVKLSADRDDIFFTNNSYEELTFKISVTMNPFCSAQCNYEFFDISTGEYIDNGSFNIASVFSKSKTYTINRSDIVQGQILNRFEVNCKSKKTALCYTREGENARAVLVTLNYGLSEEEKQLREKLKKDVISLGESVYLSGKILEEAEKNAEAMKNYFFTEDYKGRLEELSDMFSESNNSFEYLKWLWERQNLVLFAGDFPGVWNETQELYEESDKIGSSIVSDISSYNNLADNLTHSRNVLSELSEANLSASLCEELNNLTHQFNSNVRKFMEKSDLEDKEDIVEKISFDVAEFKDKTESVADSVSSCSLTENITRAKKIDLFLINKSVPEIPLKEPVSVCCFLGKCEQCCDERCSKENYPVIFLHGHSINRALPADYSLDALVGIKENLARGGYVDAGAVVIQSTPEQGLWGMVNAPIAVTASYFFDTYKTEKGEETTVSSKTDSIDTYAIRLKSIVDIIKYRTDKEKVVIVAHSMGGLVTRRYIQIFGGEDVDRIILISVPNHGIDNKVRDYCALIGPEVACKEMDKDSIFINKLNNAPTDRVPTYNIIGIGCNMGDETGDGIVKNSSQYLDYAKNYYVEGICNELNFDFFHEYILYPDKYPEVYRVVRETILNEN